MQTKIFCWPAAADSCMCKHTLDMAPRVSEPNAGALRIGTRCREITRLHSHRPTRLYANEINHAFAFPAEAGLHLQIPEGWKAELAYLSDYVPKWFTRRRYGHPSKY